MYDDCTVKRVRKRSGQLPLTGTMEITMIYTVTFNPSLDYVVQVEHFKNDTVNRTCEEYIYPGGKGNNVAVVVSNLGLKSRALGFKAGFTGEIMEKMLQTYGCDTDFITLEKGVTRINVKVKSDSEFEINGQGPEIPKNKLRELYDKLEKIRDGDVLVLSGSIPDTLPDNIYEYIMERVRKKKILISVDAEKGLLFNVLKYHPFLVKPNRHELEEMFGVTLENDAEIVGYARMLQEMGAQNVLVSMAEDGAILVSEEGQVLKQLPHSGKVVNSVGAGDSMIAGFLAGYLKTGDYAEALRLGTAAGSATAFTSWLASAQDIYSIYDRLM